MAKMREFLASWWCSSESGKFERLAPVLLSLLLAVTGVSLFVFGEITPFLCEFKRLLNYSASLAPYSELTPEITVFQPFTYLLFWVLNRASLLLSVKVVWGIYTLFCLFLIWQSFQIIAPKRALCVVLCCPIFLAIWSGGVELLVVSLICFGIAGLYSPRCWTSMICLAVASAIMPEVALFSLLFLYQKKWQEFLLYGIFCGVLYLGGHLLLAGSVKEIHYQIIAERNMREYIYVYKSPDSIINYSMLMIWQLFDWAFAFRVVLFLYTLFGWMLGAMIVIKGWLSKSWWLAVSGISLIFVLLPMVSTYSRLLFLLPILLFSWQRELPLRYQLVSTLILGLVWLPIPAVSLIVTCLLSVGLIFVLLKKSHF